MRLLFLSFTLISASFVNAQQTYVPDNNFEAYLEANSMGNGVPNDDYVTTANISGVSSLIIGGANIADLTGIEDFSNLSTLCQRRHPLWKPPRIVSRLCGVQCCVVSLGGFAATGTVPYR